MDICFLFSIGREGADLEPFGIKTNQNKFFHLHKQVQVIGMDFVLV